jgi:hypothetical protein
MTNQQGAPEALRLAEQYDHGDPAAHGNAWKAAVCNELRRLHSEVTTLQAELAAMRAEGEPVAEMVPYHTPSGKRVAVISRFQHLPIGTKLYTHPQPAAQDAEDAARLERERICAAIKAEDDYCVENGDYMLDSDDCIKIVRGEWVRPDYLVDAARKQGGQS